MVRNILRGKKKKKKKVWKRKKHQHAMQSEDHVKSACLRTQKSICCKISISTKYGWQKQNIMTKTNIYSFLLFNLFKVRADKTPENSGWVYYCI